jgi:hypothetical protein
MKTSCFGSRISCSFRKALRTAATSGRSCSAACMLFFKGQVDVMEKSRNRRLAHVHDIARFALTLDESANSTQSHVVQLGNFHTGMAGFDAATTRSRKSSE